VIGEGLTTYMHQLAENWEIGELDILEVIISHGGKRFAAIGVERDGKALATGKNCDMAFVWIFKINDAGQFTYVREYNDTNAIGQTFM